MYPLFYLIPCSHLTVEMTQIIRKVCGIPRWTCNVCNCLNEVGMEYFCTLDGDGQRRDLDERPELNCGAVEYVAPPEYMVMTLICDLNAVSIRALAPKSIRLGIPIAFLNGL